MDAGDILSRKIELTTKKQMNFKSRILTKESKTHNSINNEKHYCSASKKTSRP